MPSAVQNQHCYESANFPENRAQQRVFSQASLPWSSAVGRGLKVLPQLPPLGSVKLATCRRLHMNDVAAVKEATITVPTTVTATSQAASRNFESFAVSFVPGEGPPSMAEGAGVGGIPADSRISQVRVSLGGL